MWLALVSDEQQDTLNAELQVLPDVMGAVELQGSLRGHSENVTVRSYAASDGSSRAAHLRALQIYCIWMLGQATHHLQCSGRLVQQIWSNICLAVSMLPRISDIPAHMQVVIPHSHDVQLEDYEVFDGHLAVLAALFLSPR